MPIYRYLCQACRYDTEIFKPIAQLDKPEPCPKCSVGMQRQLCAPAVLGDYPGYTCPVTGNWIEGRRAHQENLKKQGCRLLEPGEREEVSRRARQADRQLDDAIDKTVEQFVHELPSEKREKLVAEVQNGYDVQVVRN